VLSIFHASEREADRLLALKNSLPTTFNIFFMYNWPASRLHLLSFTGTGSMTAHPVNALLKIKNIMESFYMH